MAISAPQILIPTSTDNFRTTSKSQIVSGTIVSSEANDVRYRYDIIDERTGEIPNYTGEYLQEAITVVKDGDLLDTGAPYPWSFKASVLGAPWTPGNTLCVEFIAMDAETGEISLPTYIKMTLTTIADRILSAPVPTGVLVRRNNQYLEVACAGVSVENYTGDLIGYNFYVSNTPGGGAGGYSLMNSSYVEFPTGTRQISAPIRSVSSEVDGLVVETKVSGLLKGEEFTFRLDKSLLDELVATGLLASSTYDNQSVFYFTVTSIVYEPTLGYLVESPYSTEVSGKFITFAATPSNVPERSREQIISSMIQRILGGKNKDANLIPSSVYRDILDPVSEEFASYYVIQDFYAQTASIKTLAQFDDENGDGVSDPVDTSIKKSRLKSALKMPDSNAVQALIDSFFDKKAANHEITRLKAQPSRGRALLYASDVPPEGLVINDGAVLSTGPGFGTNGSAIRFIVLGTKKIYESNKQNYFNPVEQRYEIEVEIVSYAAGSLGNVPVGAINQIVSGADSRYRVTNVSPTFGGTNRESNLSLANRAQLAIAGLDTGTKTGILLRALSVPGVRSARVVQSGDEDMLRDKDPDTGRHLGGTVDVYVESSILGERQDIIAFSYDGPAGTNAGEKFFVEDANLFRVRTNNSLVTPSTPIFEVVKVVNVTRGAAYDTAGALVGTGSGDSIQLAQNSKNLSIGMATLDVIEVDYRFRGSNTYVLENQPVNAIVSVVGDIDGELPTESYSLVKLEDPLLLGNSTKARDGVAIEFYNGFPSESTRQVTAEAYLFLSTQPIRIVKKGVDVDSLVVSADSEGFYVYQRDVDYTVGKGGLQGYTYLYLQPFSKIRAGSQVYLSYSHSQNLTVTYTVNEALQRVQEALESARNSTADIAVKGCIQNFVDIAIQVIRERGFSEDVVKSKIQTILANHISSLKVGEGINLDDMIKMVKDVPGVRTVHLPIPRMMKQNGSLIQMDYLGFADFVVYNTNANRGVTSYVSLRPVLNYGTVDGGGDVNLFRAVYENERALVTAGSPLDVSTALGRSYILADGRIIVSTTDGTPPQTKEYSATYYTFLEPGEDYAADIKAGVTESLVVGSNSILVDASAETN